MILGRVRGPVWGARHAAGLDGAKLLEIEPLAVREGALAAGGDALVAVDALGAGPGELVLVAHGSRVRDLTVGATVADKDVVVAIVDGTALAEPA
jgi:ethanolamine utilization protein EutN